jgi:hypothetical protein
LRHRPHPIAPVNLYQLIDRQFHQSVLFYTDLRSTQPQSDFRRPGRPK